ncbi:MAG: DnaJ domain-containing protein [Actinomycetales bacterium]|nr:DnaJ domain-containing protein [Actinomycetales bacterium]
MDRERAAEVLGVAADANRAEVSAAFQRAARRTHPDAGGDEEAFREVAAARDVLLAAAGEGLAGGGAAAGAAPGGPRRAPAGAGSFGPESAPPRPQGPALLAAWVAILAVAGFLEVYGVPHPLAPWEPIARWLLVVGGALGFALSGARWALALGVLAYVATLVTTLFVTTLGGLVGLLLAIPALYGLMLAGLARRRLVRLARAARDGRVRPGPGADAAPN